MWFFLELVIAICTVKYVSKSTSRRISLRTYLCQAETCMKRKQLLGSSRIFVQVDLNLASVYST
jgi:hypothetical protein